MSTLTIKQALDLGEGAIIPHLGPVTFKAVYAINRGTTNAGEPYERQDCVVTDASQPDGVKLKFWSCPEAAGLRGQTKVLHSSKSGNGRLSGITVKSNIFKGVTTLELHVANTALVTDPEGQPAAPAAAPAQPVFKSMVVDPLPGSIADKPIVDKPKATEPQWKGPARVTFEDAVALFDKCYAEALRITLRPNPQGDINTALQHPAAAGYLQAVQAAAATLFIQANKDGLALGAAKR